jgi:hypothetical protein
MFDLHLDEFAFVKDNNFTWKDVVLVHFEILERHFAINSVVPLINVDSGLLLQYLL